MPTGSFELVSALRLFDVYLPVGRHAPCQGDSLMHFECQGKMLLAESFVLWF